MRTTKAKWKRAPLDQRRVTGERSAPKSRFTRRQRSGALPSPLPSNRGGRNGTPMLVIVGVTVLLVSLSITLVIAVGAWIQAQQTYEDVQWRATYYSPPTQPFATLVPDFGERVGTTAPVFTTPLPGFAGVPRSQASTALAADDDPRWTRASITPLGASFDLYADPASGDAPIQTVSEAVSADVILEADWGAWAQVKLADVTAWVNSSTVYMEAVQ